MYQSDLLCRRTVRHVLFEKSRALSFSPGVDAAEVLRHAAKAYRRRRRRNAAFAALLIVYLLALINADGRRGFISLVALGVTLLVACYETCTLFSALNKLTRSTSGESAPGFASTDRVEKRLTEVAPWFTGNVTVFPASTPFFGYGITVRNWSVVINAATPAAGHEVEPFTVVELRERIARALAELGDLSPLGLEMKDRIMVSGSDISRVRKPVRDQILDTDTGMVVPLVDQGFIDELWENPDEYVRPYLTCSVTGWGGNLVLTAFIRLRCCNGLLSIEVNYSVLTPIDNRFHVVDALATPGNFWPRASIALGCMTAVPLRVLMSPVWSLVDLSRMLRGDHREKGNPRSQRDFWFDYGPGFSLREQAITFNYQKFFQRLDRELYAKAIERRLLDATEDFLTDHKVDVAAFHTQSVSGINHGVFVTGDATLSAQSIAVGNNARAGAFLSSAREG
jgi:hypothetical protein